MARVHRLQLANNAPFADFTVTGATAATTTMGTNGAAARTPSAWMPATTACASPPLPWRRCPSTEQH